MSVELPAGLVEAAGRRLAGLVAAHGEQWTTIALDRAGLEAGDQRWCFANAARVAVDHDLDYCEGWATQPYVGADRWVHHGWNVDGTGRVVDVTWPMPACQPDPRYLGRGGRRYIGVRIPASTVEAILAGRPDGDTSTVLAVLARASRAGDPIGHLVAPVG